MKLPKVLKRDYMSTVIMILVVILIVFIFWFGLRFVFATEHPVLAVASGSMRPVLYEGDLIVIEGVPNGADIEVGFKNSDNPGDIIVFPQPGDPDDLIVHRAIRKKDQGDGTYSFETRGDNNPAPDPWEVQEETIVGRYTGIKVPLMGHIALFFNPFERKVAFIALWIVVLAILELVPLVRKRFGHDDDDGDDNDDDNDDNDNDDDEESLYK
jgi:signal peptidase